jgi:hypothetical protein
LVEFAGNYILILFRSATGPVENDAVDAISLAEAECHWKFRLRKITGTTFHKAGLTRFSVKDLDARSDCVTIRFDASEAKANGVIARKLIVAEKIRGTVVGGHQQVEISITIEVTVA